MHEQLGFIDIFRYILLAFGGVALLVGAFIIFNTFSITVAQRTRELALLRCLGATRRQALVSVLAEGLASALVASLIGTGRRHRARRGPDRAVQRDGPDDPGGADRAHGRRRCRRASSSASASRWWRRSSRPLAPAASRRP